MTRRGFSLIEVLVAFAILTACAFPLLSLSAGRVISYGPKQSRATYLLRDVVEVCVALPRARLVKVLAASAEAGNGYREVQLESLGLASKTLDARFFVRFEEHVLGQFGLARLDCAVGFADQGKTRWLGRSALKRDEAALDALAELRVNGPFESVDGGAFPASLRAVAENQANHVVALQKPGSPFVIAVLPPRVRELSPPSFDEARAGAYADQLTDLSDATRFVAGADLPEGHLPRPNLAEGIGVAF